MEAMYMETSTFQLNSKLLSLQLPIITYMDFILKKQLDPKMRTEI